VGDAVVEPASCASPTQRVMSSSSWRSKHQRSNDGHASQSAVKKVSTASDVGSPSASDQQAETTARGVQKETCL